MRILVTGTNGQVGGELIRTLAPLGEVVTCDRAAMDLANAASIRNYVRLVTPDIIVHPGAYTAVDKAESEPDLAMAINGVAPGVLAEEAKRRNALLISYSTDYVFDGAKAGPYLESDIPNPVNVYGATKLAGERAIKAIGVAHMILRTSWVYGARGNNFMRTMLRLAGERDELKIIDDQIGAPTWCRALASATARMIETRLAKAGTSPASQFDGIFHVTGSGRTTWFGFASEIIGQTTAARGRSPKLIPIPTEQYPTPAKRPHNSLLALDRLSETFGFTLDPWQEDLKRVLAEVAP